MAELLQALHYFRTFKKDDWKLKSYVAVTFAIDTIAAVADYIAVYLYTITHAGASAGLLKYFSAKLEFNSSERRFRLSDQTELGRASVPHLHLLRRLFLVQTFLTFRYWRLTKNTIFVCFLLILILASLGAGFTTAFTVALFPAYKDRNKVQISAPGYVITQFSADLIIAGALVRELMRAKSLFKGQRRINNMLNRLVLRTLQTGTATAVFAVMALIAFQINAENNVSVGILYTSRPRLRPQHGTSQTWNIRESGRSQNSAISGGQQGTVQFAHGTTCNFTTEFCPSGPDSTNSGTTKSSALPLCSSQQVSQKPSLPEIEMGPTDTKQVPEV
ncbi:hypothetical protein MSAN_02348200 [Mycena sanguinolenta]|uniref:DUF6534 domain-containing protein n=1 Tax=Mycena sanguinolenta TaxID=230812 RepID=A0A8H6X6T0_9AGAR|nr:hypothetical protein MSAN_02348200 [Mycena sanguinolenta]